MSVLCITGISLNFTSIPGYLASAIALGESHTCAIVTGGTLKCWGYNGYGQLGIGGTSNQYNPVVVSLGGKLSPLLPHPAIKSY